MGNFEKNKLCDNFDIRNKIFIHNLHIKYRIICLKISEIKKILLDTLTDVHLRRLWKADFSLASLAKDPHLVLSSLKICYNN
jgi:hypothetical protein